MKGELEIDARGLIHEAYRIEGITAAECRSVFLDWVIGLDEAARAEHLQRLVDHYGPRHPGHPMTAVLTEGLARPAVPPRRRGGARGRREG
jgi:hypothetical protein